MNNFNLHIEKTVKKNFYLATVRAENGKVMATNNFHNEIDVSLLTRLEDSVGMNLMGNAQTIRRFGNDLFNTVFKGPVLDYYQSKRDTNIRLKLCFNKKDLELLRIPWEFMFDGDNFLSANPKMAMTRVLKGVSRSKRKKVRGRLRMLAVISSPLDLPEFHRPNVEKERMIILQAIARSYASDKIQVDFLDKASLRNIQERLYKKKYHIFHFTGHGIYSQRERMCYVLLEDDFGNTKRVDNDTIAHLLSCHGSLRLVMLSGCQTAVAVGHRVLGDLPAPLLEKKIPTVITMQYSVTNQSIMDFAREFYTGICDRLPLDLALTNARTALLARGNQGLVDFGTPILYGEEPDCLWAEEA